MARPARSALGNSVSLETHLGGTARAQTAKGSAPSRLRRASAHAHPAPSAGERVRPSPAPAAGEARTPVSPVPIPTARQRARPLSPEVALLRNGPLLLSDSGAAGRWIACTACTLSCGSSCDDRDPGTQPACSQTASQGWRATCGNRRRGPNLVWPRALALCFPPSTQLTCKVQIAPIPSGPFAGPMS